jgi:hypothetical protein
MEDARMISFAKILPGHSGITLVHKLVYPSSTLLASTQIILFSFLEMLKF